MQSEQYPSYFQGEKRPKSNASWDDVQEFVNVLSKIPEIQSLLNEINIVGAKFRLPSDAEWEYAARGGLKSEGFKYVGSNKIKEVGWYDHNSQSETKPVGLKYSNELGIFDMSGNIWEWCEDDWHDNYFGAPVNGKPWIGKPKRGINKVCRGGCCFNLPPRCRVSCRGKSLKNVRLSYLGFRLALTVAEESKQ